MLKLEKMVRAAFLATSAYNKRRGYRPPDANIRRNRAGLRVVGPRSYRISMYLDPVLFGELEQRRARSTRYQNLSLSAFIVHELSEPRGARAAGRRTERRAAHA